MKWWDPVLNEISAFGSILPREAAGRLAVLLRRSHIITRLVEGNTRTMLDFMVGRTWDEPMRCNEAVRDWFANASWFISNNVVKVRSIDQLGDELFWANLDGVLASLLNLQTN